MNTTIKTLYNLLGINIKIPYLPTRVQYLHEIWGLNQDTIGEIEGISQQSVSVQLIKSREFVSRETFLKEVDLIFTVDEIRYIQFLPREIIKDIEVVAFVNNVLGLEVYHPFFMHYDHVNNLRIAALYHMGVMNRQLMRIFDKKQTAVSNIASRYKGKLDVQRSNRYDSTAKYALGLQKRKANFLLAGGQEV